MSSDTFEKAGSGSVDRRTILRGAAAFAASVPLQNLMIRRAQGAAIASPYGPIAPVPDNNTGLNLLQLPIDFQYWSFGWIGDPLDDGTPTPALHDGMAVVREYSLNDRRLVLCRNHEVDGGVPAFSGGPVQYSPNAGGGNTNIVWNTQTKKLERAWPSLTGTVRNCAGGVTPWESWISCEETIRTTDGGRFKHGYCFDVDATARGKANSTPLKDMGRFAHEAVCVDPSTGYVYETEDGPSAPGDTGSGFYRFIPKTYGRLARGGKLQMLRIAGEPKKNMQPVASGPTVWNVEWVDIGNPDPNLEAGAAGCFAQGFAQGGASFRRLEGCWFGLGKVYFCSTDGGPVAVGSTNGEGQVFEYDPVAQTLRCIYHSENVGHCENPDNLLVTPRGAMLLCEDNSGSALVPNAGERLLGLTLGGDIFTFAQNNMNFTAAGLGPYTRPESGITFSTDQRQNEWAGACFNSAGDFLFVNIQTPGITFAITGPWERGPI